MPSHVKTSLLSWVQDFWSHPLRVLWVAGIGTLVIYTLLPQVGLTEQDTGFGLDKVARVIYFFLLALYPVASFPSFKVGLLLATCLAPLGFVLEVLQKYVPGRHFSPEDMIANNLGSIIGIILAVLIRFFFRTGESTAMHQSKKPAETSSRAQTENPVQFLHPLIKTGQSFRPFSFLKQFRTKKTAKPESSLDFTSSRKKFLSRRLIWLLLVLLLLVIALLLVSIIPDHTKEKMTFQLRSTLSRKSVDSVPDPSTKIAYPIDKTTKKQIHQDEDPVIKGRLNRDSEQSEERLVPGNELSVRTEADGKVGASDKDRSSADQRPSIEAERDKSPAVQKKQNNSSDSDMPGFAIQVGAYRNEDNARELAQTLQESGYQPVVFPEQGQTGKTWYKIRIGRYETHQEAEEALQVYHRHFAAKGFVISVQRR